MYVSVWPYCCYECWTTEAATHIDSHGQSGQNLVDRQKASTSACTGWHQGVQFLVTMYVVMVFNISAAYNGCLSLFFFLFFFFGVSGELSTLRQMMKVTNEPGLSPNNGLENAFLSDQSMASNGQAERFGAKTTSYDGKAGHVMTHVCHRARQEQRQVRPCKRRCRKHATLHLAQRLDRLSCRAKQCQVSTSSKSMVACENV